MISYKQPQLAASANDGFAEVLRETQEAFREHNLSVLGPGFQDIVAEDVLWEEYTDCILKGVEVASEEAELRQFLNTQRRLAVAGDVLSEAVAGVQSLPSLSPPTIRKLWPKTAMKSAIPTQVVQLPSFDVSFMLPYIEDADGVKHYLPEAIDDDTNGLVEGRAIYSSDIYIDAHDYGAGDVDEIDFTAVRNAGVTATSGHDTVSKDARVVSYKMFVTQQVGGSATATVEVTNLRITPDVNGFFQIDCSSIHPSDLEADGVTLKDTAVLVTDTVFGRFDYASHSLLLTRKNAAAAANRAMSAKVVGKFSEEFNEYGESVSFDITTQPIQIGTGTHLNAALPIEFLQDTMAMYQIDGATKVIDAMTNIFAQKLDRELKAFIVDMYNYAPDFSATFDAQPGPNYSGNPHDWRSLIQDALEDQAARLTQARYFDTGRFVVMGNTVDVRQCQVVVQWSGWPTA